MPKSCLLKNIDGAMHCIDSHKINVMNFANK